MKKKKLIIILAIILIILTIVIVRIIIQINKPKTTVDDFSSVKELIEFDGHEYIAMENSTEDGYEKDIYINFCKPSINDDGTTNQDLYEVVINHIAKFNRGHNFRLIDQEKNILIRIQYNENGNISLYTINNDNKYWEHIKTNFQIENYQEEKLTSFTITSPILANIINENWVYNNVNLGTKDGTENNYEVYTEEGYQVRKLGAEIFNIVFTNEYNEEIVDGILSTTSIEDVENIIGEPTYRDDINGIIGYRCEYFYIFFSDYGISIYHPDVYDEKNSKRFGELVTELNSTGDMNTFLNRLTDLYPNYSEFIDNNNCIRIKYPVLGFEIRMGYPSQNGVIIYSNFKGWVTENKTIDDIMETREMPANIYTKLETNLVFSAESDRVAVYNMVISGE